MPSAAVGAVARTAAVADGAGRAEELMVPDATFTSYYGRPVVKASPWEADIPAYLFMGGWPPGRRCSPPAPT